MIVKPRTSREILAEDYEWPMTAGKVSKLAGVTARTLRHYDKKGLLKVARTGEAVANDRKLYYPEDVERLKRILVLTTYGFSLDEVAVILDNDLSVADALGLRLEELHRQERLIRNLILFAHFAALVGDDVFETLAFGTSDIDALRRCSQIDGGLSGLSCATGRIVGRGERRALVALLRYRGELSGYRRRVVLCGSGAACRALVPMVLRGLLSDKGRGVPLAMDAVRRWR